MSVTAVLRGNRRLAAGLLTAVAVASLAACGSDADAAGDSGGTGGTENGGGDARGGGGRMAAYIQCLAQNGVTITMPSRGPGGAGMPSGAPPSGAPTDLPSGEPGVRPSGGPGGGGREITKPDGVDDATWTKATEACAAQKPGADGAAASSAPS